MVTPNLEESPVPEVMLPQVSACGNSAVTWPPADEVIERDLCVGMQIGPYVLLERIGHGGMGVVFKAEQLFPLKRIVALKLIRLGMESGDVLKRFEQERQSLAILDHPGIASVFDAGSTENGRPFFAMEFVPGQPITLFSDAKRLTVRQRLELLAEICDAVQHAHFKGIIHRDLKPGNLLVVRPTVDGGKWFAKVIDFGIAKAIGADHDDNDQSDSRLPTTSRFSILGTPEYMSPEQLKGDDVDSRSDVYSLGAILYELLTGKIPFDRHAARPIIFDGSSRNGALDAVRPSKRLSQLEETDLAAVAGARGVDPKNLVRTLRGDLDSIVLKALEEDREKRYATPTDLARDIARYLAGKPVTATAATRTYLARKFVRRHKVVVVLAATAVLALVGGTIGTATGMLNARAAEREAEAERQDAQRTLAELYPGTGLAAAGRGDWSEAALWFAQSTKSAEMGKGDAALVALNRVRVEAAQRNCVLPVAAFDVGNARTSSMTFDPSGRYVLVAAGPAAIAKGKADATIWDLQTQAPIHLPAGIAKLASAAWTTDGARVALAAADKSVGVTVFRFPQLDQPVVMKEARDVDEVKFDRSGGLLLGRGGRVVRVWHADAGTPASAAIKHPKDVLSADFTSDSTGLLSSCADEKARLFLLDNAQPKTSKVDPVFSVSHSGVASSNPDASVAPVLLAGDQFVTVASDALEIRRHSDGEIASTLRTGGVTRWLASSADGERIAASVAGRLMTARRIPGDEGYMWDDAVGPRPIGTVSGKFSSDGHWILAISEDGQAHVVRLDESDDQRTKVPFHAHPIDAAAWSSDGSRFATAQEGGLVRVWAMNEPSPFRVALIPTNAGRSAVRFSPDGQFLLPTGEVSAEARELHADLHSIRVYNADGSPAGPSIDPAGIIVAAAFSREGNTVVAAVRGEAENRLYAWDWRTGKPRGAPIVLPSDPRSLAVRPGAASESEVAVLCEGGEIVIADLRKLRVSRRFEVGSAGRARWIAMGRLVFSPDGTSIASWGERDDVSVCDSRTGLRFKISHKSGVRDARFSPDGNMLLSLGGDGAARLTDVRTGSRISEVAAGLGASMSLLSSANASAATPIVRFSPDGASYIVVSDGLIRLFACSGDASKTRLLSHPQPVTIAEFSPDGRWILAACKDGTVRLWEASSAQLAAVTHVPSVSVPRSMDISADGRRVVISGDAASAEVLSLDAMVSPKAPGATDDKSMGAMAELVSGRTLENGSLAPLTDSQWLSRWNAVGKPSISPNEDWNRQQVASLSSAGDYRAAAYHFGNIHSPGLSDAESLAIARAGVGEFADAAARLGTIVGSRPVDGALRLNRGDLLLAQGDAAGAAAEFEGALADESAQKKETSNWIRGHWWVSRSYPAGIDLQFPPEGSVSTDAVDGPASIDPKLWTYTACDGPWVDFNALLHVAHEHAGSPKTAFAQTFIYAREAQKLSLSVGTDDQGRIWLNREVIYTYTGKQRGAFRGQGRIIVNLRPGWNTLLAKVVDLGRSEHELFASLSSDPADVRVAEAQIIGDRADAAGQRGDFDAARIDLTAALELVPQDSQRWQQLAAIELNAGNHAAWREVCRKFVMTLGDSKERHIAERIARICNSADDSGIEASILKDAGDRAMTGGNDPYIEFFQLARGMVEYRAKNYVQASDWLEQSRGSKGSGACHAIATFYLAMSQNCLNDQAGARKFFEEASDELRRLDDKGAERPAEWNDRLAAKVARAEAAGLILAGEQTSKR